MSLKARLSPGGVVCLALAAAIVSPLTLRAAQQAEGDSSISVPPLIRYKGTILNGQGTAAITFSLYAEQTGGAPLWQETQNVTLDKSGRYSVILGATEPDGIPVNLFVSGAARWLGTAVAGQEQQGRVMLVSVPYAAKAGDADTVGGLPASAFVLADSGEHAAPASSPATVASGITGVTPKSEASATTTGNIRPADVTSGGSVQYPLAEYQGPDTLGPSNITADSSGDDLTVPNALTASTVGGDVGTFGSLETTGYLTMTDNTSPKLAPEIHLTGYNQAWVAPGIDVASQPSSTDLVMAGLLNNSGTVTDLIYLRRNKAGNGTITDDSGFPTLGIFCTPPGTTSVLSVCNSALYPARDMLDLISPANFGGNYLRFINEAGTPVVTFNGTGTNNGSDFQITAISAQNGSPNPVLESNRGTTLTVGDSSTTAQNWGGTLNVDQASGGSVIFGNGSGQGFGAADGGGAYFGSSPGHNIYFKPGNVALATLTAGGNFGIGTTTPGATLEVNGNAQFDQGASFLQAVTLPGVTVNGAAQFNQGVTFEQSVTLSALASGDLALTPVSTASSTQGYNSGPLDAAASVYNSSTSAAQNMLFRWQAEPAAGSNNTANPAATLNLLYGANGAPGETGMSVNANGTINFAAGQTFPGSGSNAGVHGFSAAGQSAAYNGGNWVTLSTTGSSPTQEWRLSATLMQDSSVTCATYGTASIAFEWTDARGVMQTSSANLTFAAAPAGGFPLSLGPSGPIRISPGTPILVSVQYTPGTGCGGNGSTYTANAVAEQLQ